jgi:hypothetical protein
MARCTRSLLHVARRCQGTVWRIGTNAAVLGGPGPGVALRGALAARRAALGGCLERSGGSRDVRGTGTTPARGRRHPDRREASLPRLPDFRRSRDIFPCTRRWSRYSVGLASLYHEGGERADAPFRDNAVPWRYSRQRFEGFSSLASRGGTHRAARYARRELAGARPSSTFQVPRAWPRTLGSSDRYPEWPPRREAANLVERVTEDLAAEARRLRAASVGLEPVSAPFDRKP